MASFWCKVACDLDNHPKIRRAGNLGSQVFQYALRKNASPGIAVPGLLPEALMDAWYIADQLQISEADAQLGIQQACVAGLLAPAERAFRIVGWDDGEWGRGDQTAGRHIGGRARAEKAKRAPNGAFLPSNVQQTTSIDQVQIQLDQQPAKTEDVRRKTEERDVREEQHNLSSPAARPRVSRVKSKPGEPTDIERASAMVVLGRLTKQSGVEYRGSTKHVRLITARMRDGASEIDLRAVIGYCATELKWKSKPEMMPYLRPETLFGPETIERYLDAARTWWAKLDLPPTNETPVRREPGRVIDLSDAQLDLGGAQ